MHRQQFIVHHFRQIALALLLFGVLPNLFAQSYKLMRFEEDYSILADSTRHGYARIKFSPLTADGKIWLSIGGEARAEYVDFSNEDWGRLQLGHNNFLLQRYSLHADIHFGKRLRLFTQVRSALQHGRKNGSRQIDEDQLNIQNLFIDGTILQQDNRSLLLRIGRQELDYGSGRLISVGEGPNARRYFTGAKIAYNVGKINLEAFAMMADTIRPGIFDNSPSKQINLWGAYGKITVPKQANFDLYYIGIYRDRSIFKEGTSAETRHTIGGRIWKYGGGFIYNLEGAYQFGSFGKGKISAWTASLDIGYLFEESDLRPSINLRNDYISGDKKAGDGNLQTFNPIYPKGGYFGFSPQIGPVNLIDIHPYVTLDLLSNLKFQADLVYNWRHSLQDGVYRPSGSFNLAGAASRKRYIGTAYLANFTYAASKQLSLVTGIQYFKTGAFIEEIINTPKNGIFFNGRVAFKF